MYHQTTNPQSRRSGATSGRLPPASKIYINPFYSLIHLCGFIREPRFHGVCVNTGGVSIDGSDSSSCSCLFLCYILHQPSAGLSVLTGKGKGAALSENKRTHDAHTHVYSTYDSSPE